MAPYQFVFSSANDETCLVGACSRRTLFYLQSTLNHSYGGDYDFSNVQSDEFSHEPSVCWVKNFIDSTLTAALSSQYTPQIKNQVSLKSGLKNSENFKSTWNFFVIYFKLWTSLEKEITLADCEIFSFNPEKEPNDEEVGYCFRHV